jgi:hypothetical protein
MNGIKIQLSVLARGLPSAEERQKHRPPSLKDRIEYAIDCIECEHNKQEAIEFLQAVHNRLLKVQPYRDEHRILVERIKPVLNEYGTFHISAD